MNQKHREKDDQSTESDNRQHGVCRLGYTAKSILSIGNASAISLLQDSNSASTVDDAEGKSITFGEEMNFSNFSERSNVSVEESTGHDSTTPFAIAMSVVGGIFFMIIAYVWLHIRKKCCLDTIESNLIMKMGDQRYLIWTGMHGPDNPYPEKDDLGRRLPVKKRPEDENVPDKQVFATKRGEESPIEVSSLLPNAFCRWFCCLYDCDCGPFGRCGVPRKSDYEMTIYTDKQVRVTKVVKTGMCYPLKQLLKQFRKCIGNGCTPNNDMDDNDPFSCCSPHHDPDSTDTDMNEKLRKMYANRNPHTSMDQESRAGMTSLPAESRPDMKSLPAESRPDMKSLPAKSLITIREELELTSRAGQGQSVSVGQSQPPEVRRSMLVRRSNTTNDDSTNQASNGADYTGRYRPLDFVFSRAEFREMVKSDWEGTHV